MTRILVQRGTGSSSSSNQSQAGSSSAVRPETQVTVTPQVLSSIKDEEIGSNSQELHVGNELFEYCGSADAKAAKRDELMIEGISVDRNEIFCSEIDANEKLVDAEGAKSGDLVKGFGELTIIEGSTADSEGSSSASPNAASESPQPPPPPVPPPKPLATISNSRRSALGSSSSVRSGSSRRAVAWPVVSARTSPTGSRPSSPMSHGDCEGYNSADEQNLCFVSSYDDLVGSY